MNSYPETIIIRHVKENLRKCTLSSITTRSDCRFFCYPDCRNESMWDTSEYVLLDFEGKPLSDQDRDKGIVLLDATWRYAMKMFQNIQGIKQLPKRSLPVMLKTAYPRRQNDCPDPERGLASIEALFVAYHILGRDASTLLDNYYWKDVFINNNLHIIDL